MAAPRVGEQLVVQDPLEGPEQDSGQVALVFSAWNTDPDPATQWILKTFPDPHVTLLKKVSIF